VETSFHSCQGRSLRIRLAGIYHNLRELIPMLAVSC
jgi:hypothetical protein